MALSTTILNQIRDEIGQDTDITDSDLELIYEDENRGNFSVLVTALIVWKRRMANLQARAFDVSSGGTLLSRRQRIVFIAGQITRLEALVDDTHKGQNMTVSTKLDEDYPTYTSAEFSS